MTVESLMLMTTQAPTHTANSRARANETRWPARARRRDTTTRSRWLATSAWKRAALSSLLISVACCGSAPPTPAPNASTDSARRASAATDCVPADRIDATTILPESVRLQGNTVTFCSGYEPVSCAAWDVATNRLSSVAATAPAAATLPEPFKGVLGEPNVQLCPQARDCQPVAPRSARVVRVEVSEDRRHALVSAEVDRGITPTTSVALFELATARELARHTIAEADGPCGYGRFFGNAMVIQSDVCAGPGGSSRLVVGPGLTHRAAIGGDGFAGYDVQAVPLGDSRWALKDTSGTVVAIQDLRSGVVEHRIPLTSGAHREDAGDTSPVNGGIVVQQTPAGTRVIALHDRGGKLYAYFIDPDAGRVVDVRTPSLCATPSTP